MEAILVDSVQSSLRHFMYHNAIFMCERLCAEFPSELNLQLLAGCYLHNNQPYAAYQILKGTQLSQSRYLFATSCFQMDLLNEAESALCPANEPSAEVPNGAAGHYLLGLIYRYTDRKKNAIHHFKQALLMDPLLWAAYEELCKLGSADEAASVFGEVAAICIQNQHLNNGLACQNTQTSSEDNNLEPGRNFDSEDISPRGVRHVNTSSIRDVSRNYNGVNMSAASSIQFLNGGSAHSSFYNTPSPMAVQLSGVPPPPLCKNVPPNCPNLNTVSLDISPRSIVNSTIQAPRRKFVDEGKLRKISERLFSDSRPRRSTRLAGEAAASTTSGAGTITGNGVGHSSKYIGASKLSSVTVRAGTVRKGQGWANECSDEGVRQELRDDSRLSVATSNSSPSSDCRSLEQDGATVPVSGNVLSSSSVLTGASEILSLLRILGEGFRFSCMYRCQDALDAYLKLPQKHYNTGWVLSQVGKAYFELIDYLEADRAFSLARLASPYSLEGIDIYSTSLFLLKEDMKLSYLAQEMIATDRLAPQSWCAMGNCYSLQKDHETALKNFQRAVKLNPRFAYAHTLCGHEYVALEDYEHGIKSYQCALRIDARHYNAWYGLGLIYLRQEKLEFAEHHFRMAFQINPHSSVIMSYLGTTFHALKKNNEALQMIDRAISSDKKNPLPRYQKANILVSMEMFDEALQVLEELKEYAPRESSIYALMGKIYKRTNMYDKAMLNFGLALDLKPPATDVATIKAAIEKLHVPDELEDTL